MSALVIARIALVAGLVWGGGVAIAEASPRSVSLVRVVARLDPEIPWASISAGQACVQQSKRYWQGGDDDLGVERYVTIFRKEMREAGFEHAKASGDLFEARSPDPDYMVAAALTAVRAKFCSPADSGAKGSAVMDVEWQIYSRARGEVVARVRTSAAYGLSIPRSDGVQAVLDGAFAENARRLLMSKEFATSTVTRPKAAGPPVPRVQEPLLLTGASGARPVKISDAVGSVVVIVTADGHGSGFLVARDGHLLTNQHVVGDAQRVKVRWSDGQETIGEVVRTDAGRDVALIKTDPRGHQPLALRLDSSLPGETVFAIGAPLDQQFQNTVTRGVASSSRVFDGYAFLQSDVAVSPGNSGGPLLDEKGHVVAITVSGFRLGDSPTGINLFIPARDALTFLGLELHDETKPPARGAGG